MDIVVTGCTNIREIPSTVGIAYFTARNVMLNKQSRF